MTLSDNARSARQPSVAGGKNRNKVGAQSALAARIAIDTCPAVLDAGGERSTYFVRQASDASGAWSRKRRGVMRAHGIEGVGATPVHRSAVSRPGLHSGEVIAQSGMAGVHEPGE